MKKVKWNYNEKFILKNIKEFISYLFFINNVNKIELSFIALTLKQVFKDNNIVLKKNNKIRNINTYIKENYGGFVKMFNNNLVPNLILKKNIVHITI